MKRIDPKAVKWWKSAKTDVGVDMAATVEFLIKNQTDRQAQSMQHARLYRDQVAFSKADLARPAFHERVSHNIVASCIDTVHSRMQKNKPAPMFLPRAGDYRVRRKAIRLNTFVAGLFYENDAYALGAQVFRDGEIWGSGFAKGLIENGRFRFERVLESNLFVDPVEARETKPRSLYQVKLVDRDVLLERFGRKDAIRDANSYTSETSYESPDNRTISDQVRVFEGWRLPDGPERPGRHIIATCEGEVLLDEEWTLEVFPFVKFDWSEPVMGWMGMGIAEQLTSLQLELNLLLIAISRAHYFGMGKKLLVSAALGLNPQSVGNDPRGSVIVAKGPIAGNALVIDPTILPAEIYAEVERKTARAYQLIGISQLSAAAQKPAGLNSGVAIREALDVENDRTQTVAEAYQNFFVNLAKLAIVMVGEHLKSQGRGANYEVRAPGQGSLKVVSWKDCELEPDDYALQCWPVSLLPQTPSGRLQTIQELIQAGMISPKAGRSLMALPDLDLWNREQDAAQDRIDMVIDHIIDESEYGAEDAPDPFDDLAAIVETCQQQILLGKVDGLEPEKLDLLQRYMADAKELMDKAQAPAAGGAPGTPQVPQGQPMPAPQSELMPQVAA